MRTHTFFTLKAVLLLFITLIWGCNDSGSDPQPTTTPTITPTTTPTTTTTTQKTYQFRAALIGSTGHMMLSLTPGDPNNPLHTGIDTVTVVMGDNASDHNQENSADKHELTQSTPPIADWDAGQPLDHTFTDGEVSVKVTATQADLSDLTAEVTMEGHDKIMVAMFENKKENPVEVYEGVFITTFDEYNSEGNENLKAKQFFNIVLDPAEKRFQIISKGFETGPNSGILESDLDDVNSHLRQTILGVYSIEEEEIMLTLDLIAGATSPTIIRATLSEVNGVRMITGETKKIIDDAGLKNDLDPVKIKSHQDGNDYTSCPVFVMVDPDGSGHLVFSLDSNNNYLDKDGNPVSMEAVTPTSYPGCFSKQFRTTPSTSNWSAKHVL